MKHMHLLPVQGRPWMVRCKFDYHPRVVDYVKEIPGADWEGKQAFGENSPYANTKVWLLACEMVPDVCAYAERHQFQIHGDRSGTYPMPRTLDSNSPNLQGAKGPWQPRAVLAGAKDYAWLYDDETGLGKGWEVIKSLQLIGAQSAIVVCPAQVRLVWHNPYYHDTPRKGRRGEFDKWWPEHPRVSVIEPGKPFDRVLGPIIVVSYEMLPKLLDVLRLGSGSAPDAIVFDEIHYLQSGKAARSIAAEELVRRYPSAWRAGMTATAITNQPSTIANPLNILFPGRFVTGWKFAKRYCNESFNEAGFSVFKGLREEHAGELRQRLNAVSSRACKTDADVAPYLPKFEFQPPIYVNPRSRLREVAQWTIGKWAENPKHICLLTHLRHSAEYLAGELSGVREIREDGHVFMIHGDLEQKERMALIEEARNSPRSIICATLHSVNVGIDMAFHDVLAFAEIYTRPADMIQASGRFNRLSGDTRCDGFIFASEDLDDGAEQLAEKLSAIAEVIKPGMSEAQMSGSLAHLAGKQLSEEEITAALNGLAESYNPELGGLTDDTPF